MTSADEDDKAVFDGGDGEAVFDGRDGTFDDDPTFIDDDGDTSLPSDFTPSIPKTNRGRCVSDVREAVVLHTGARADGGCECQGWRPEPRWEEWS